MSAHEYFPKGANISGYFRYPNAIADEITATPRCYARIRDASRDAGMPPCSLRMDSACTTMATTHPRIRAGMKTTPLGKRHRSCQCLMIGISDLNRSWTSAAEPAACWR